MQESGYQLNLGELARRHFKLNGRNVADHEKTVINESVRFAQKAVHEYQRLIEQQEDEVRAEYMRSRRMVDAAELVQVVELARSLRGRATTAGDLWAALTYMLDRNLSEADWTTVMDNLEQLSHASR